MLDLVVERWSMTDNIAFTSQNVDSTLSFFECCNRIARISVPCDDVMIEEFFRVNYGESQNVKI
jgi:hypothetical protein